MSTAATSSTPKSAVYVLLSRIAYELQEVFSTKIKISVLETGLGLRQLPGQPKFSYSQLHVILNSLPSRGSDHKLLTYIRDIKNSGK